MSRSQGLSGLMEQDNTNSMKEVTLISLFLPH